ncbi:MAG: Flp pilus assembly complex ATPase component [Deltaproteobacteria bacterium]|nr:Flp pilus assembly complex ATPase component [Deltaproteobacteria bacterium]
MAAKETRSGAGEDLVKKDLITREDLDKAKAGEAETGTPWYKQLLQMQKISFEAVEEVMRYEFHPRDLRTKHQSLGDTLVAEGVLSQAALKKALAEQKRTGRLLGNILQERGMASRDAIGRALGKQYDLEFASIDETPSEPAALDALPVSVARKHKMIPVFLEGDRLTVLITSPQTLGRLKEAGLLLGTRIHAMVTSTDDVMAEITARYENHGVVSGDPAVAASGQQSNRKSAKPRKQVEAVTEEELEEEGEYEVEEETADLEEKERARFENIAKQASGSSVMKMVSTIIEGAVNSGATDVHIDPQEPETRVRYRIDGTLHDIMSIPQSMEAAVVSRIKIIADLDITEARHPQDGHISMDIGDREFDIRVATLPTFLGERVVLRLLDQSSVLSGIRDLGLESEDEKKFGRLIDEPYGMILVTGPTGSGKTTTLYSAINQKNVMTDSIVTLEDPVEYQLSGINQVQIETDIDLTFANTLRAALRQDIDVLLVGEIRDSETARIAIRAAMTGHLVFSTLHTNDAPEAIATLRNMGVPSYLISSALTAVIAQRLVRTICTECKTSFAPTQALLKSIKMPATAKKLYRGKGCETCYNTGYRGRSGIFEILEVTPAVRRMIAQEESAESIAKAAKLKTMAMRCRDKVKKGIVTPEEFLRVIRT